MQPEKRDCLKSLLEAGVQGQVQALEGGTVLHYRTSQKCRYLFFFARQAKGSSHAPEIPTPTPAVNLRFNIDGLTKGLEGVGGLLVGEVEEKPELLPVDASSRDLRVN